MPGRVGVNQYEDLVWKCGFLRKYPVFMDLLNAEHFDMLDFEN